MANLQRAIVCGVEVQGDGVNNTFILDLLHDPYVILFGSGVLGTAQNWFAQNPGATQPIGVGGISPSTATLVDNVITFTLSSAPPVGQNVIEFTLFF